MSVTLAILFVLMIMAPCLLALRSWRQDAVDEQTLARKEGDANLLATDAAPVGSAEVPMRAVAGALQEQGSEASDIEEPAVVAPVISATTLKIAAEMVAKAAVAKAEAAKVQASVLPAAAAVAPVALVASSLPANFAPESPVPAIARPIGAASVLERSDPDAMTLPQLVQRAEYEARVAEAAALRAVAAASDAAARAAAMRAKAAIDAAHYARAVATEAAEAAQVSRAAMNELTAADVTEQKTLEPTEHRRAA